jgi:hypothetical protein
MGWNIREIWYVSGTLSSKGLIQKVVAVASVLALLALASSCATGTVGGSSSSSGGSARDGRTDVALLAGPSPTVASATTVTFAGARCAAGSCSCREPGRDDAETAPPPDGSKRFEIRLSAAGGTGALDLSGLGTVATAPSPDALSNVRDTCAYIDVPSGSTHDATFVAKESAPGQGVAPRLRIAEYGPKGHFWYDLIAITCEGPDGRCDRDAADRWAVAARQRKRGRLDPCGSTVVTKLVWETSGGQAARDGGLFRDFTTRFTMEVKKFATQFAPGSTECLPK